MRLGSLVLTAALVAATAAAQDRSAGAAPAVAVAAGFDGYYTAGRWVPVRVDAENRGADFEGEVRVEWGATMYRQALSLPAPSRKRVEFYVRAADLRDSLHVVLHDADGRPVSGHDVAVRGLLPAEALHVIAGSPAEAPEHARVAFVDTAELPLTWRGYDGVDDVRVDAAAALLPAQARALERWRAVRDIDDVPGLRREIPRLAGTGTLDARRWRFVAVYLGALLFVLGVLPRLGRRPLLPHAALAAAVLLFAAVPAIMGLSDPGATAPFAMKPHTTGAGTFTSTLMFARPVDRSTAVVMSAPGTEALLEAAPDAPPHEIRYAGDGDASFAITGSAGETFSVIGRSFGSLE